MSDTIQIHPVAEMFPIMDRGGKEFIDLVDSIREDGLQEPLVMDGDVLIDGRNRLVACEVAQVEPRFVQFSEVRKGEVGVTEWIWAKNFTRRQMTVDQRVAVAAKVNAWRTEEAKAQAKQKTQFKKGSSPNPGGKKKSEVNMNSCSPERDTKEMHANSTIGQIAALAQTSNHKAAQAKKIFSAVIRGDVAADTLDRVIGGGLDLSEAVKLVPQKPKKKTMVKPLKERVEKSFAAFLARFAASDLVTVKKLVSKLISE